MNTSKKRNQQQVNRVDLTSEDKPRERIIENGQPIVVADNGDVYSMIEVFKTNESAVIPTYGTQDSSCFDLSACLSVDTHVTGYTKTNEKIDKRVVLHSDQVPYLVIEPGERVLVPTGLIFDLPENHTMKIYPRSGVSLKSGVRLANCTGIVDADYVDPSFVILENSTIVRFPVKHGDRIAQAEVVKNSPKVSFKVVNKAPPKKTDRNGGFGSTGK